MDKLKHKPEFRARLRELIQGFVEHCEFSRNLIGQIERTFEHGGSRYGVPVFTFYGTPLHSLETGFVGLMGVNGPGERLPAEILLQLIERLAIQPNIASGRVLRLMPVTDPVALELGDRGEAANENEQLARIVTGFQSQYLDGLIEIHAGDQDVLCIQAKGDSAFREGLERSREALLRLANEDSLTAPIDDEELPEAFEGDWHMSIIVPRSWSDSLAVHWVSQFLVVFFRAHADAQLRRGVDYINS